MSEPIWHDGEASSNRWRAELARVEPVAQRTYTPSLAVIERSAGIYHWTPEGRKLADFSSGVLVSNLGHNPRAWLAGLLRYMEWSTSSAADVDGYARVPPLTAYNAVTPLEVEAAKRLLASLRAHPEGTRLERVLWSASGSEGIQKAIWACLSFAPTRNVILATRRGFHGKKGLAGAVTGDEHAPERDPRVQFISFPQAECRDLDDALPFDWEPYQRELDSLAARFPDRINCLVTEPYLGGGGSFHPPREYLRNLARFCRERGILFVLDEVQSNFGRTGRMYAFEAYGIEPDIVVLGKGMGNGIPVNALAGRADILDSLRHGDASDTWSAHPLGCAAVLATLDLFEQSSLLDHVREVSKVFRAELVRLRELGLVAAVRGEGMVWGIEFGPVGKLSASQIANLAVKDCYLGDDQGHAIHLLGPLAGCVVRISPPLTITLDEARHWLGVLRAILTLLETRIQRGEVE